MSAMTHTKLFALLICLISLTSLIREGSCQEGQEEPKFFSSNLLKLPRNIQNQIIEKHLKVASRQLEKLRRSHYQLTKYPLKTLKKLLKLNNVALSDVTSSLRRKLPLPGGDLYNDLLQSGSNVVPSLIRYGGTMVPSILNYSREMVPSVIEEGMEMVPSLLEYGGRMVPPLLQYGGDMVNSVWSNPGQLQVAAEKIADYFSGSQIPQMDEKYTKHTLDLINEAGFIGSEHEVVTADGYILSMHRIEHPANVGTAGREVVFLQHGLLCSSAVWVLGDRSKALGFMLADAGFDVWMGNYRGNTYSRNHTYLDPDQDEFWQFSWDQMGLYDIPSMLQHVQHITRHQDGIVYIGHSMGTTAFWVFCNEYPQLSQSLVKLMIGMAPVTAVQNITPTLRYIAPLGDKIEKVATLTGNSQFGTTAVEILKDNILKAVPGICGPISSYQQRDDSSAGEGLPSNDSICDLTDNIFLKMSGFYDAQMNYTLLPHILGHVPAGVSAKTLLQFAQGINSKRFCHFDYGDQESNYAVYGDTSPPDYSLDMVQVPVILYWGDNDWLASPQDVRRLASQLPRLIASIQVPYVGWNHADFMWAKDADVLLYKPVIEIIQNFDAFK